jgi:addiction module RelE/StbE family toxin
VIVFAEEALADLERIFGFVFERDPDTALEHLAKIRSAVLALDDHPEIGRPAAPGSTLRELIISHGRSGYVALYEFSPQAQIVRVVAIRHQREAGYRGR